MNYSIEAAQALCSGKGITDGETRDMIAKAIDLEAQDIVDSKILKGERHQWSKALDIALERVMGWWDQAGEYNIEPLSSFVASHRRSCAITILLSRGL